MLEGSGYKEMDKVLIPGEHMSCDKGNIHSIYR